MQRIVDNLVLALAIATVETWSWQVATMGRLPIEGHVSFESWRGAKAVLAEHSRRAIAS